MEAEAAVGEAPEAAGKDLLDRREWDPLHELEARVGVDPHLVEAPVRRQQEAAVGAALQAITSVDGAPPRRAQRLEEDVRVARDVGAREALDQVVGGGS